MAIGFTLRITLLLLLSFAVDARSQQHVIPQNIEKPVQLGELVCVELPSGENECGKIISAGSDFFTLETNPEEAPVPPKKERAPATKKKNMPAHIPSPTPRPEPTALPNPLPTPTPTPEAKTDLKHCERTLASIDFNHAVVEPSKFSNFRSAVGGIAAINAYNLAIGVEKLDVAGFDFGARFSTAFATVRSNSMSVFGGSLYTKLGLETVLSGFYTSAGFNLTFIRATLVTLKVTRTLTTLSPYVESGMAFKLSRDIDLTPKAGLQYNIGISGDKSSFEYSGISPYFGVELGIMF